MPHSWESYLSVSTKRKKLTLNLDLASHAGTPDTREEEWREKKNASDHTGCRGGRRSTSVKFYVREAF